MPTRPTRPPDHPATCECFGCNTYWSLSLEYETAIMRTRWERDRSARVTALMHEGQDRGNLLDYTDSPFAGEGFEDRYDQRVLLKHFREAWFQAERDGFTTAGVSMEVVWAYKVRCFETACARARDELGRGPHLRTEKALKVEMTKTRLRMALLVDIANKSSGADAELARKEAARLQLELHPQVGASL